MCCSGFCGNGGNAQYVCGKRWFWLCGNGKKVVFGALVGSGFCGVGGVVEMVGMVEIAVVWCIVVVVVCCWGKRWKRWKGATRVRKKAVLAVWERQ